MNATFHNSTHHHGPLTTGDYFILSSQVITVVVCFFTLLLLLLLRKEKTIEYRGITPFIGVLCTLILCVRLFFTSFSHIIEATNKFFIFFY